MNKKRSKKKINIKIQKKKSKEKKSKYNHDVKNISNHIKSDQYYNSMNHKSQDWAQPIELT